MRKVSVPLLWYNAVNPYKDHKALGKPRAFYAALLVALNRDFHAGVGLGVHE